jgi:hypothetical protein
VSLLPFFVRQRDICPVLPGLPIDVFIGAMLLVVVLKRTQQAYTTILSAETNPKFSLIYYRR